MNTARIITVHSFRRGAGRSSVTANLATLLAAGGGRIGVIDTDLQSPNIHVLFGLDEDMITHSLNDYLNGDCGIAETAYDVTPRPAIPPEGHVFLVPSNSKATAIAQVLREGYDVSALIAGFHRLIEQLRLDVLLIDTQPGLNEETLLSMAISDVLLVLLRLDQQDYQGTAVTVEVARRLDVPRTLLIVNKVPDVYDVGDVRREIEHTYQRTVSAILPHSDDMLVLASSGIFVLRHPAHPMTMSLRRLAAELAG